MPLIATRGAASAQGFGEFAQSAAPVYIEDVFSTYLYTGTASSRTITNGLDLSGKGGMVWIKKRSGAGNNWVFDTSRGALKGLITESTGAEQNSPNSLTAFGSSGFNLGTSSDTNGSGDDNVAWAFREQPKFFDVVTYTGNGSARTISHNLGSTPGCIIVRSISAAGSWYVYHRGMPSANYYIRLNLTDAQATSTAVWNNTAPTSTVFSVGTNAAVNGSGVTYVAYLFAHNAGGFGLTGTDNVISCGSYTGTGSDPGPTITLGFEPQWILYKGTTAGAALEWTVADVSRGMTVSSTMARLYPNLSDAETNQQTRINPTATGFTITSTDGSINGSGENYIYIAIRRGPMKTPTTGSSVFAPTYYNGDVTNNRLVNTGLFTDAVFVRNTNNIITGSFRLASRMTGNLYLRSSVTSAQTSATNAFMAPASGFGNSFSSQNGFNVGTDATAYLNNSTDNIAEAFRRAPGFFDVVCYTASGTIPSNISHNLGVVPELIIVKKRSSTDTWTVYSAATGNAKESSLNNAGTPSTNVNVWNSTTPTSSVFTVGLSGAVNGAGDTYVALLFATCPGVSKVGSYTGTGATQTISCGFTGGARFVLIKRIDNTGNWHVWDTARGMVAGTDPRSAFNQDAADTNANWVYTTTGGFQIVTTDTSVNASGGTYLYLAIA